MGKGTGISREISKALEEISRSNLDYRLTAMGTILEGEWNAVMKTVKKVRDRLLRNSARVYIVLTIDDRRGAQKRIDYKVKRVERLLKKTLKK